MKHDQRRCARRMRAQPDFGVEAAPCCSPGKFSAFERFPHPGEHAELSISPEDTAFATYPCLTEEENAAYCTAVLERLHADRVHIEGAVEGAPA